MDIEGATANCFKPMFQRNMLLCNTLGLHLLHECTKALTGDGRKQDEAHCIHASKHHHLQSWPQRQCFQCSSLLPRSPRQAASLPSNNLYMRARRCRESIQAACAKQGARGWGSMRYVHQAKPAWALQGTPASGSAGMRSGSYAQFTGVQQLRCSCAKGFMSSANVALAYIRSK